MTNSISSS